MDAEGGHTRLKELGYEQRLNRRLSLAGSVAITMSDITPAGSLLVVGIAVVAVAGTGSVLAYLAGCVLAVTVAMCMAELGSMYPLAGGLYSIVSRVLGTPAAFLTLLSYAVQAIFLPASIALGIGTYLHSLNAAFPVSISAAVAMVLVTGLAMLRIDTNALMTGVFLALEMLVIVVVAAAGFSHPTQPLSVFVHPVGLAGGKLGVLRRGRRGGRGSHCHAVGQRLRRRHRLCGGDQGLDEDRREGGAHLLLTRDRA